MARQRFFVVLDVDPAASKAGSVASYDKHDIATWLDVACGEANPSAETLVYDSLNDLVADYVDRDGAFSAEGDS